MTRWLCALMFVVMACPAFPAVAPAESVAFITRAFNLTSQDFAVLEERRPLIRTLDVADDREISTLGAVRVNVPAAFYIDQLRDIVAFKRSSAVRQIGVFSTSARPDDAAALTLDADDVEDLARCRPGSCKMQLSKAAILRFARDVPWNREGAAAAANRVLREVLADLVNGYRETGDAALMTYVDGRHPLSVSEQFRFLTASPPMVLSRFPPLREHFQQFPASRVPGVQNIVYWSKEKLGPATVISVTHMAVVQLSQRPIVFVAASRQLFSTHYFDASLGITAVIQESGNPVAPSYVVYVNRSRLDAFDGFLGGLKRAIVKSRARSAISRHLLTARDRVERRFEMP